MIKFAFLTLIASSATPPSSALTECISEVEKKPNDLNTVHCLHRLSFEQPLDVLDKLESQLPQGRLFELVRGNINWRLDPKQALINYRNAAETLERQGEDLAAMLARSNAAKLLLWRLARPKEASAEITRLEKLTSTTQIPAARRRGIILWSSFAADTDTRIGKAYRWISQIPDSDIEHMSFGEKRDFLGTRARLRGLMLQFSDAQRDFVALEEASVEQGAVAARTRALAMIDSNRLEYRRYELNPDELPSRLPSFEKRLRQTRRVSLDARRKDYAVAALDLLARTLSSHPRHRESAMEAARQCLDESRDDARIAGLFALCLLDQSRLIEAENPSQAHTLSEKAIAILGSSGLRENRLRGWRRYMRSAWMALPRQEALNIATQAIEEIEDLRSHQRDKAARQTMFTLWTEDYYWLASRLLVESSGNKEDLAKAFSILEQSRARVLLEYMPGPGEPAAGSEVREQERRAQNQFVELQTVQSQLQPNEAFLVYQIANERSLTGERIGGSWVIVVTRDSVKPVKLKISRSELSRSVSIVRDMAKDENPAIKIALQGLNARLLAPATKELPEEIEHLVVVADGPLHALPFFSINSKYVYTTVQSATIWSKIRDSRSSKELVPSGISLVDPARRSGEGRTNPPDPKSNLRQSQGEPDTSVPLIEGHREAAAMKESLSGSIRAFSGEQANTETLRTHWGDADNILHISAHSEVDTENPQDSRILLSNRSDSMSGDLRVGDIYKLPLAKDLVVLAGCSTGWGSWISGEGILSLARAFQIGGASAVVASLWPIRDDQAADFFEVFYEHLGAGEPVARSLALAQSDLRDRGYPPQAYEGYVVIGDGSMKFQPRKSSSVLVILLLALPLMLGVTAFVLSRKRRRARLG